MRKTHSTKYWFFLFLIIYSLLSSAAAVIVTVCTLNNLREEAAQERHELLDFYIEQTDTALKNAYHSLIDITQNNRDIVALQMEDNVSENALCKSSLSKALSSLTASRREITGYFLYITKDALGNDFFTFSSNGTQSQVNNVSRSILSGFVNSTIASSDFQADQWFIAPISGQYYLVCITYNRNTYTGCYINMNSLIKPLDKIDSQRGYSVFTDASGLILTDSFLESNQVNLSSDNTSYKTEAFGGEKYIAIHAKSSSASMYLVALIPNQTIFSSFSPFFITLLTVLLAGIILPPLILLLIWSIINRPLSGLLCTIEQVKAGNADARATTATSITEMATLNQSFNEMMEETHKLKISIYEERLKERQTYLDYLQIQIHPHFFLNCLNLIYSLAELRRHDKIKEFSLSLVKYFRFLFHHSSSMVFVKDELDHVQNYINIQHFRFPDGINCTINVEDGLEEALIPPISIQTFVENSVKYAQSVDKQTEIRIKVERYGEKIRISVRDNGKGFPPDVLIALNSGKRINEDETHRIGITNVNERIALLFGEEATTHFYNNQGSVSEFTIPFLLER